MPETDVVILKALIEAHSSFVSGNTLAVELGISRVGVWARLEKLRQGGFVVEAVRHRGYRLIGEPPTLSEDLIKAYLELGHSNVELIFRNEVDSTNTEAERQLADGRPTPFAVIAQRQTKGRGRMGRPWHSDDEGNLYSSFGFRPQMPPSQMQMITLWMGLRICNFINLSLGLSAMVKWPNDIVSGGRKLSGILAEARVDSDRTRDLIFGIGINVNSHCEKWPQDMTAVATSLATLNKKPLKMNQVAAELIQTVNNAYESYVSGEYRKEIFELWTRYDALKGHIVKGSKGKDVIVGKADGIDEHGNLLLILENGQIQKIHAGEVSIGTRPETFSR
ncbi:MAG: biotin--[acetyl-CoA-carboxylase] ligase [Opitutales bacterium]|jgi:BirA family biotin operon repressor/biotin-[acetyl-CoA-carboxylase] ligase